MTDAALQRLNMVESQIRPSDVTDRRILRAMAEIAREAFVPAELAAFAYMDEPVPLVAMAKPGDLRRSLMAPRTFAKLIQLAQIEPSDRVLIAGAGRGYSAAVISHLAREVVALEADEAFAGGAKAALAGFANVVVETGALIQGAPSRPPFDVIVIDGTVWEPPAMLLARLKDGGRLVGVLAADGVAHAALWQRVGDHFAHTAAFEAAAGPLPGFARTPTFVL